MALSMPPTVLVIAGLDSSCGAGLLTDVRALTDLGADAVCAATAVTAQTDSQVIAVHHVPPAAIRAQITAALHAKRVSAVKIGMLGTADTVDAVADSLPTRDSPALPIILDPVLLASSGGVLLDSAGQEAMRKGLLPRTTLLTPNLPEAAALLGTAPASGESAVLDQAQQLLSLGPEAVLIKGGHSTDTDAIDYFVPRAGPVIRLSLPRVAATQRGTGCALAAAIAAGMASGLSLATACRLAKEYVHKLLRNPPRGGRLG